MIKHCDICIVGEYHKFYNGDVRDGAFGGVKYDATVYECSHCGVQKLKDEDCIPEEYYETGKYREKLEESLKSSEAVIEQDKMQHYTLNTIFPYSLRGKFILDVGCGIGSLLDNLKNISSCQIDVEPCVPYLESLSERGYKVYPSLLDAETEYGSSIDSMADSLWKSYLENSKQSDNLYMELSVLEND